MTLAEAITAVNQVRTELMRLSLRGVAEQDLHELSERLTIPLRVLIAHESASHAPTTTTNTDPDDDVIPTVADLMTEIDRRIQSAVGEKYWLDASRLTNLISSIVARQVRTVSDSMMAQRIVAPTDSLLEIVAQRAESAAVAAVDRATRDRNWLELPALNTLIDQKIARRVRTVADSLMAQQIVAPPDSLLNSVTQHAETAATAAVDRATRDWGRVIKERFEDEFSTRLRQSGPLILDLIRGWLPGEIRASLRAWLADSHTDSDDSE